VSPLYSNVTRGGLQFVGLEGIGKWGR